MVMDALAFKYGSHECIHGKMTKNGHFLSHVVYLFVVVFGKFNTDSALDPGKIVMNMFWYTLQPGKFLLCVC